MGEKAETNPKGLIDLITTTKDRRLPNMLLCCQAAAAGAEIMWLIRTMGMNP